MARRTTTLEIRVKGLKDNEAVTALFACPGMRYHGTTHLIDRTARRVSPNGKGFNAIELVAALDARLLGYATLFRLLQPDCNIGSIHIGVLEECRGRGIADVLLHALLTSLPDPSLGLSKLELIAYANDGTDPLPRSLIGAYH